MVMNIHSFYIAGCVILTLAGTSWAQTTGSDIGPIKRQHSAWDALLSEEGHFLTSSQFASLNNLAFQAAVARICDDRELDQNAFAKKLDLLADVENNNMAPAQNEQRKAAIMVAFGARFGIFLTEGSQDKNEFCKSADELKQKKSLSVLKE